MSVVVKGMEMPENCMSCDIETSYNYCPRLCRDTSDIRWDKRFDDCPLVELPEKHGRLIDADCVLEEIRHGLGIKNLSFLYTAEKSIVNHIIHAPTIIEAEGAEEVKR